MNSAVEQKTLVPWNRRRLPLRSYVFLIVVEVFFEVCCWVVGEFFVYWLSFGLLKSKVQKMNQTPLRLRLVACFGLALIVLFATFMGRLAYGEEEGMRIEAGAPGAVKGVAIAAPHEAYDATGDIAPQIGRDLGIGWVVGHGYRSVKRKVYLNVNRPTQNLYDGDEREKGETETPEARAVYDEYQRKVYEAAGVAHGPLRLLIEIHGHARRVEVEGRRQIEQVIELATGGFTREELSSIRQAWESAGNPEQGNDVRPVPPLAIELLDPRYEYKGEQIRFYWNAGPAKRTGSLRPECAQRFLHFELPPEARRGPGKAGFLAAAEALLREALKRV